MAFILNIETATKNCSVSLANEGKTIACKEIAEQTMIMIRMILEGSRHLDEAMIR